MDGTLSPDRKLVFHGSKWNPALLSPDGRYYALEGQWHPVLVSIPAEKIPLNITQDASTILHRIKFLRADNPSLFTAISLSLVVLLLALFSVTSSTMLVSQWQSANEGGGERFKLGLFGGGLETTQWNSEIGGFEDFNYFHPSECALYTGEHPNQHIPVDSRVSLLKLGIVCGFSNQDWEYGYIPDIMVISVSLGALMSMVAVARIVNYERKALEKKSVLRATLISGVLLSLTPIMWCIGFALARVISNEEGWGLLQKTPEILLILAKGSEPLHFGLAFYSAIVAGFLQLGLYRHCKANFD